MSIAVNTTQRAYTMRLKGLEGDKDWRRNLWHTHNLANRGAQAFGDWLLTMRGGLPHELAQADTAEETKNRRIVLAMSWLSVESLLGSPAKQHIETAPNQKGKKQNTAVLDALQKILEKRGLDPTETNSWLNDCRDSLSAAIRDDAVWVNRSDCFDDFCNQTGAGINRDAAQHNIFLFIDEKKFFFLKSGDSEESAPKADSLNLGQTARKWLSSNWGSGEKNNPLIIQKHLFMITKSDLMALKGKSGEDFRSLLAQTLKLSEDQNDWKTIKRSIGWMSGSPSSAARILEEAAQAKTLNEELFEKVLERCSKEADSIKVPDKDITNWNQKIRSLLETKIGSPYRSPKDRIDEFSVLLDHGARHVSVAHSWVLLQEGERIQFREDAAKIHLVPVAAKEYLDRYCAEQEVLTHAVMRYVIRQRAISGWDKLVSVWASLADGSEEERIQAARELQAEDTEGGKFGDINLFEQMAAEEALCVWRRENGKADDTILRDYVRAQWAETQMQRFKVPMYRHPHPLLHPVFCDFGKSRFKITYAAQKPKDNVPPKSMVICVYTGAGFNEQTLLWQSSRLEKDIISGQPSKDEDTDTPAEVTRADRLGRAAANISSQEKTAVLSVFDSKDWNGRLQAPRKELERTWRQMNQAGLSAAEKEAILLEHIGHMNWFITFSPQLQPKGPWLDYAVAHQLKPHSKTPFAWRQSFEPKNRGSLAKSNYCRLPDFRILSVDLGHRHAASCAVLETFSSSQLHDLCKQTNSEPPSAEAMYFSLPDLEVPTRKQWFRRIAGDQLADKSPHPACWACIERQFTIKLSGEDGSVRGVRSRELVEAAAFCEDLGLVNIELPKTSVDKLMDFCLRQFRLSLSRHSDLARISFAFGADYSYGVGGVKIQLTPENQLFERTKALQWWYQLATGKNAVSESCRRLWQNFIAEGDTVTELPAAVADGSRERRSKKQQREQFSRLMERAKRISQDRCLAISREFHVLWSDEDALLQKRLRWLRNWFMPSQGHWKEISGTGGLSLDRIGRLQALYRVNKAFFMRLKPSGRQMLSSAESEGEEIPLTASDRFGRRMLDQFEKLRENRTRQLVSRIIAAALGLDKKLQKQFEACHAVVIENLEHYRPDEMRTRRENRQLMQWASGKVKKQLEDACHLYGLLLGEVSANYTSRQDSRTGMAGIRCVDISAEVFFREEGYYQREINKALERREKNTATPADWLLLDIQQQGEEAFSRKAIRLPRPGGDLFVSSSPDSPAARGLQADLNAAVNIGLRALTDPDWSGRWWFVPINNSTKKPEGQSMKGSPVIDSTSPFTAITGTAGKNTTVNIWRDLSAESPADSHWMHTTDYWLETTRRVIQILRRWNGLSDEEIPY